MNTCERRTSSVAFNADTVTPTMNTPARTAPALQERSSTDLLRGHNSTMSTIWTEINRVVNQSHHPLKSPSDRLIRKYAPPTPTRWEVASEDTDNAVISVMAFAKPTIAIVPQIPAFPTTHPNLRYMMAPKMVRIDGINTPRSVPYFFTSC